LNSKLGILTPFVEEKIRSGNVAKHSADVEDLTLSFLGLASMFLHRWFSDQKNYDFTSKIPTIAQIFLHGTSQHDMS